MCLRHSFFFYIFKVYLFGTYMNKMFNTIILPLIAFYGLPIFIQHPKKTYIFRNKNNILTGKQQLQTKEKYTE